jgi:predicted transposase/invertase (TIGR01784 family)
MGIIFLELPKIDVKKPIETMSDLEEWAFYLKYSNDPRYRSSINTLKKEKEAFRMAYDTQSYLSNDLSARAYFLSRLKYELDASNDYYIGMEQGLQQGVQQGENKIKYIVVRNLVADNLPMPRIIQYTGLTEDEINSILTKTEDQDEQE